MIIIKTLIRLSFVLIGLVILGVSFLVVPKTGAWEDEQENYVLCHNNPSQSVTLEFNNENAYQNHLGKPHNEQVYDTEGECDSDQNELPSMSSVVSCGQVQLEFFNPTPYYFAFEYRKDNEAGTDDFWTTFNGGLIAGGPYAGQPFGQKYNIVNLNGGAGVHYASEVVTFPEDSGTHTVAYRLWRGAENDWYLPWESVEVSTNCLPDEPKEPVVPQPEVINRTPSTTTAYQCPNSDLQEAVKFPMVVRNGSRATVTWFWNLGNSANVYYRETGQTVWQHSVPDVARNGDFASVEILSLNPALGYDYGIQAKVGCGGGVISVIVDPPAEGKVFYFSHFE